MKQYYININNRQEGPFEESVILAGVASGEYDANAYIWCEGMEKWETISEHFPSDVTPSPMERVDAIANNKQTLCISSTEEEKHTRHQFKAKVQQGIRSIKTCLAATAKCCRKWYGVSSPIIKKGICEAARYATKLTCLYFEQFKKKKSVRVITCIVVLLFTSCFVICIYTEKKKEPTYIPTVSTYTPKTQILPSKAYRPHTTHITPTQQQRNAARTKLQSMGIPLHDLDNFLFATIAMGDAELARLPLEAGANVNARYLLDGDTPLIKATCLGHTQIVRLLLSYGADVNAKSGNGGSSAIDNAITRKHVDITKLLIDAGAHINKQDTSGDRLTPLIMAAHNHLDDVCEYLIKAGAYVNLRDAAGRNALAHTLMNPHYKQEAIVNLLLRAGADPNVKFSIDDKNHNITPLMISVFNEKPAIVRALLHAGARVNDVNNEGISALAFAKTLPLNNSVREIIRILQASGAQN